jgi:putative FmdB family regulatory protein
VGVPDGVLEWSPEVIDGVPLYEYQCPKCGTFEIIQKFSDAPLVVCPTCGSEVTKLLSAPAFQFKGTGWYVTDYARKGSGGEKKSEGAKDAGGESAAKDSGGKDAGTKDSGTSTSSDTKKTSTTTK